MFRPFGKVIVSDLLFWDLEGCSQAKTHFQLMQFTQFGATKERMV